MAVRITWKQALAWRMQRHLLDPPGTLPVARVVDRLCGVQAQVASSAELAVRVRQKASRPGEVGRALSEGRLVKTWAMRGALHLLSPEEGGAFLSLMAADRLWRRWQRYFGMTTRQMDVLRRAIRNALEGEPLTRVELAEAVIAQRGLGRVGEALRSSYGELLKPLAWQGDLCFGPSRDTRVTFTRPEAASARWNGPAECRRGGARRDRCVLPHLRAGELRGPPRLASRVGRRATASDLVRHGGRPAGRGRGGR